MLMSLGMFVFSVPTIAYQDLQRKNEWRHAKAARIGARDAVQFVGPGEETIGLSGTAFAELSDAAASLDDLREMAKDGEAWPLVDAAGTVYGSFVITTIDEKQKHHAPDGSARQIDFSIELFGVDDPAPQSQA
ncbi:MAG TPA: phage tail protein [Allosphingosinicella sp.]|uniref:phage tail protein n=1 Tax=Allosphingosinicella sp. TaxID=2823234 RepID=UPI002ED9FE20